MIGCKNMKNSQLLKFGPTTSSLTKYHLPPLVFYCFAAVIAQCCVSCLFTSSSPFTMWEGRNFPIILAGWGEESGIGGETTILSIVLAILALPKLNLMSLSIFFLAKNDFKSVREFTELSFPLELDVVFFLCSILGWNSIFFQVFFPFVYNSSIFCLTTFAYLLFCFDFFYSLSSVFPSYFFLEIINLCFFFF